ncbi:MAG: hypothetical protein KC731_20205 [Myxococcales bacterium]|nr:hypothetical protein [Myxococcales bacterium]
MPTAQIVLLVLAGLVLLLRIARLVSGRAKGEDAPTYPEPKLHLDDDPEQPHDLFGELRSTLEADHDADVRYLDDGDVERQLSERMPVSRKVLLAGASVGLLVAIPYLSPSLAFLQLVRPAPTEEAPPPPQTAGGPLPTASVGEAHLPGATLDQQARAKELDAPVADSRGPIAGGGKESTKFAPKVEEDKPPRSIEDPSGKALSHFFDKLARVESKQEGAQARILYFGDSIVASDFVSGKLRRMLQSRFGDAGHGYALIANAWPGWFHIDVKRVASEAWGVSTCVGPYAEDGLYGLGCASFTSHHPGIWTEFGTADLDEWGRNVSRFEVEYLRQPGGGAMRLLVDGELKDTVETGSEKVELAHHVIEVPDGPHTLKLESADDRPLRLFGIRMERDVPGVMLSAMGITGARARFLDKQDDAHFAEVLKAAKPDLVCLAFGSNEITDGNMYPMDKYRQTLTAVMEQVEKAVPNASLMLVGPPDMASAKESQGHSRPMVHFIVKNQRELAEKRGWAFWDQFRAMGGGGSMWSWMKAGLGSQDMFHPTGRGGSVLGKWEYLALMEAFEKYKEAHR